MNFFKKIKTFTKDDILNLYDLHHGVDITVNATEKDVDIPLKYKNETKLLLTVTRSSVKSIYFDEDTLEFLTVFGEEEYLCKIPYSKIRDVTIKKSDEVTGSFWDDRLELEKLRSKQAKRLEIFFWILFAITLFSVFYTYHNNISIMGYQMFEVTKGLWNNDTVALGKLASIFAAMFEAMWVLLVSPIAILLYYVSLPQYIGEFLIIFGLFLFAFLSNKHEELTKTAKEKTSLDLNLELLGLQPIFKKKNFNIKENFCFYVGPFSDEYTNIYKECIYKPLQSIGLQVNRSDEIFGTRPVMDDIWDCINEASLIIAEVSGRNPNVMYEIGMAHTIGKKVIIITKSMYDVPFDLHGYRLIIYDDSEDGLKDLSTKLKLTIKKELKV